MRIAYKAFILAAVLHLAAACYAQQAGFRDLTTTWRAPDDHIPSPSPATCPSLNRTISNGDQAQASPHAPAEKLALTIGEISPAKLHVGEDFTATVRLKNIGSQKILIPWQPDGEQVSHISADGTEEKYEVADVSFRLTATGRKSIAIPLQSEGALFAQPGDPAAYFQIEPGRWVDIKLKATVACGLDDCRSDVQPDDHAILTAWWYQRVLTHQVKDCSEDHGVHKVRELDSAPRAIVVRAAATPSNVTPKRAAPNRDIASGTLPGDSRYALSPPRLAVSRSDR